MNPNALKREANNLLLILHTGKLRHQTEHVLPQLTPQATGTIDYIASLKKMQNEAKAIKPMTGLGGEKKKKKENAGRN